VVIKRFTARHLVVDPRGMLILGVGKIAAETLLKEREACASESDN